MNSKIKLSLQLGIVLLSASFIIYGFTRGEALTVLNKAVNICFECIGLG